MKNTKQQKVEILITELLKEFQGEPYWKIKVILNFLEKWTLENSNINNEIENVWKGYSSENFILFSNSSTVD